jgi:hypothetical protein
MKKRRIGRRGEEHPYSGDLVAATTPSCSSVFLFLSAAQKSHARQPASHPVYFPDPSGYIHGILDPSPEKDGNFRWNSFV